jgi:SAM-dependent methyltransferase
MNWKVKAAIQRVLSVLPGGQTVNYGLQRLRRRSLDIVDDGFEFRTELARQHLKSALKVLNRPAEAVNVYEFGVGADLLAPLMRNRLGVRAQIVIDQDPILRPALIAAVLQRLERDRDLLGIEPVPTIDTASRRTIVQDLSDKLGIRYVAPLDARSTGWNAESVDIIVSNSTLEHVPANDLLDLLTECRRVLKSDGVMCHRVDYEDHYAYTDRALSSYNFLRYSEKQWRRYNSRLQFQNRLRHKDYQTLLGEAGFEIVSVETLEPSREGLAELGSMPIAQEFRRYTIPELGTRKGTFLLRKRTTSGA